VPSRRSAKWRNSAAVDSVLRLSLLLLIFFSGLVMLPIVVECLLGCSVAESGLISRQATAGCSPAASVTRLID
jgi:hypothetical protein